MRIISSFRDYYDSVRCHGEDRQHVFQRETSPEDCSALETELESRWETIPFRGERWKDKLSVNRGILGFCGKMYPFMEIEYAYNGIKQYCWNADQVGTYLVRHAPEYFKDHWFGSKGKQKTNEMVNEKNVRKGLDETSGALISGEIFYRLNAAYFLIKKERFNKGIWSRRGSWVATRYPILGDLRFQSVIDPYAAFQEIEQYLFGVLTQAEKPMVQIRDEDQVAKKGFDTRYGFRKRPKDAT